MAVILVLVAKNSVDLSPLTRHLWAERIAHRVVEQGDEQLLYLANESDAPKVRAWYEAWKEGQLNAPEPQAPKPVVRHFLAEALQTPLSLLGLLLFVLMFVWMSVSNDWLSWLKTGEALWPAQRFSVSAYADMGVWDLWRPTLLHFSVMHLVFNSLWWWILARRIERLDGALPLLALFFFCGLIGNAVQWWYAGPAFGGVSGVTMGMLGWVGFRLRRVPYEVPKALLPVMVGWLLLTIGADTLVPGLTSSAHGAHIGGLISGFLLAAVWPVKHIKRGSDDA
ncbi:rhomboid family intramembrane serine protease [Thalassolituus sp. LLYu03]|uniref:rhomboid family intramembrane serine protease n=1 Tax=Thalassolituus sp. LLYu03 TaxID=3421656 RepID=UPI003D2BE24B